LGFDAVFLSSGAPVLRFTALAQRSYTVQFRTEATTGTWTWLTDVPAQPATRSVEIPDSLGGKLTSRFYRLITPALP
jgi:hypothetical protein